MKIVLISSHCYPKNSPRSFRTTELAKELAKRGHNVIVYAFLGDYDYTDYSKQTKIVFKNLGAPKWGIASNTGVKTNKFYTYFAYFFGKHLLFPDRAFVPYVKRAIKQEGDIDLLITVAVPHIIHNAASKSDLSRVKRWIADCGDPFMGNPFVKQPFYFERFERRWCEKCDYITVPLEEARSAYYPEYREKIRVIPQGFNFEEIQLEKYSGNPIPTFAFAGAVYKGLRDPSAFLQYLTTIEQDFRFWVFGKSWSLFAPFKEKLGEKIQYGGSVPREEMIKKISQMDFLINIPNNSGVQQPSKLIDYALSKRPILNVSSCFTEEEQCSFNEFIRGDYVHQLVVQDIEKFNIVNVANRFLELAV